MELTFGKFKGQDVKDIVKTEKGRQYLQWLVDQPVESNKWEQSNLDRNQYIRQVLSEPSKEKETTEETNAVESTLLQAILEILERIESNQRKLLTKEGISWD